MKKLLLLFIFSFYSSFILGQSFTQPTQYNQVCDDNSDGFASFYLGEIGYEIVSNLNPDDYVITHYETMTDAQLGTNTTLSSPYFNINPFSQTLYARIVTVATNEVQIYPYQITVNMPPVAPNQVVTVCASDFQCWNIAAVNPAPNETVAYFTTQADAMAGTNAIANPTCFAGLQASPTQIPLYFRLEYPLTGCYSIGTITLITVDCGGGETPCSPPLQIGTAAITQTTATVAWSNSDGTTQSLIYITPAGSPPPTATDQAYYAQGAPYVITGLQCGTSYDVYVRTYCNSANLSDWVQTSFTTVPCTIEAGQPVNLNSCVVNGQACFTLTNNDANIYNNLNQAEYTITYHLPNDVDTGANPLSSPYCITNASQVIYARLVNTTTQQVQVFGFAVIADEFTNEVITLNDLHQCDDNNDSVVTFDLTTVAAQINTTNALEYYPSLSNAQNQVVPFTNPQTLNIGTQSPITAVFVREIVPNGCDLIYTFNLYAYSNCNLAYTCNQANSLCNSLGVPFANTTNIASGGTSGCLLSTPNPTWFYLPISQAGTINLLVRQSTDPNVNVANLDADFIAFGPFTDPVTPCNGLLNSTNTIAACSYSAAATENITISNAQPGQYYLLMVTNYSNQPGYIKITEQNTTGAAAIDCSGFRFNAFLDSNNNGTKDSGEPNFSLGQFSYEVNNNGNVHNIIDPTGVLNIYDTNAVNAYNVSYTIDPAYAASYGLASPAYTNLHVVVGGGMQSYNFPITVTQAYNDLAVNIVPVNAPRPGFTYQNKILYTNNGNQTISSGTLTFYKDNLVTITGNTQAGTVPTTAGFTYTFTNLLPFETREMTVTMQVPTIPTVSIGGILFDSATIEPLTGDVVPANNMASNAQVIIGSYDPNDKMEAHGGEILYSTFTSQDYLYYTIRFENTGSASAINVKVNDVLDAKLDETSIKMVSASHNYVLDRLNNSLTWSFDTILLPPSVANTATGKGYVMFKVKPKPGYAVGDIIPNTASIYFDYNPAIITNTFNTEFVAQLGVNDFENNDFVFYPNPARDNVTVTIKGNSTFAGIVVYDISGKQIVNLKVTTPTATQTIDLSGIAKGMYLLEVTTDTNQKVVKKILVE